MGDVAHLGCTGRTRDALGILELAIGIFGDALVFFAERTPTDRTILRLLVRGRLVK